LQIFIRLSGAIIYMYKIKETPEDFVVEELIKLELDDQGQYAYFWLNKKGYTTIASGILKGTGSLSCFGNARKSLNQSSSL
jgi:hypothetical protein